ncbi:MAG: hypothetical protein NVSMB25_17170 [Thermoleophilaceae bacterium]
MSRPKMAEMVARVLGPVESELTCDECFEQLHVHVDHELGGGGGDADLAVPGMRAHLAGCPACREEHASLLALSGEEPGSEIGG